MLQWPAHFLCSSQTQLHGTMHTPFGAAGHTPSLLCCSTPVTCCLGSSSGQSRRGEQPELCLALPAADAALSRDKHCITAQEIERARGLQGETATPFAPVAAVPIQRPGAEGSKPDIGITRRQSSGEGLSRKRSSKRMNRQKSGGKSGLRRRGVQPGSFVDQLVSMCASQCKCTH